VGRNIPDVIAMQATTPFASPGRTSITWNVPGQGTTTVPYVFNYTPVGNSITWNAQGQTTNPDPSTDIGASGWGISSIKLPNNTYWQFQYSLFPNPQSTSSPVGFDLYSVTTPSNGSITYQYTTYTDTSLVGIGRCNAVCHAVQKRIETDGQGNTWITQYNYGTYDATTSNLPSSLCPIVFLPSSPSVPRLFAFWTVETDPSGNDTVHSFCAVGIVNGVIPVANQYHEIITQYYQGSAPFNGTGTLLKTVQTTYAVQAEVPNPITIGQSEGVINVLPSHVTTTTPAGTTTEVKQYTTIVPATKIGCGFGFSNATDKFDDGYSICEPVPLSTNVPRTLNIGYLLPTNETTYPSASITGTPLSTKTTTFMFQNPLNAAYTNAHMDALPRSESVSGGAAGVTTTYGYDETSESGGNNTCIAPPNAVWGNLTSTTSSYTYPGSNAGGPTQIKTSTTYTCRGMPATKIDADGNVQGAVPSQHTTTIAYDSTDLFTQSIQRPTTNGVTHTDQYSYEMNTSELISHTDENSQTTGYSYDAMGRVTSIQYPDGGGSTICYTDAGNSCPEAQTAVPPQTSVPFSLYTSTTTGTVAVPNDPITTMHSYDGWGHQYRNVLLSDPDAAGPTYVDTTYDWIGRVASVSNPFRGATTYSIIPSCGNGYTCYTYDALGRKTIQTQSDNSIQQWCYNGIVTTGQTKCSSIVESHGGFTPASWTDVADETGRHTQQVFDALGHMGAVVEPNPISGSLAMETDYQYDVFGDLLNVNQIGANESVPVTRGFAYDMPSRVTFACNPEALAMNQKCTSSSGAGTHYVYDANSNLTSKTDNRGITTYYSYDALNRLLAKRYSTNDPSGTAASFYQYDGPIAQNLSGRLVAQWTEHNINCGTTDNPCPSSPPALNSGLLQTKTSISAYDPMGRLTNEQRCMGVTNCASGGYSMSYTYDLAGKLLTYPSGYGGLAFTNGYDTAGRLSNVTQGAGQSLFSIPTYTPAGALSGVQLGTAFNMSRTYDSRQRVLTETDSIPTQ